MKQFVKGILNSFAPQWTTALMSARARAHSHRVVASWGGGVVTRKLVEQLGSRVQEGPFAGLELSVMTHLEQIGPFLLGVYESELDNAWLRVFQGNYTQIIDVGSKFGYYAIGLAKRYPAAQVVALDTDWWARKATRQMAAVNGTDNVIVKGFCSPDWIAENTLDAAFIISDCEGYEAVLFDQRTVSKLRSATLIIETHDCFVPGVSEMLCRAFGDSHVVRRIGSEGDRRTFSRSLEFLTESQRRLAEHEVRPEQIWLLLLPRTGPNRALALSGDWQSEVTA